jgi:hypothetical protein
MRLTLSTAYAVSLLIAVSLSGPAFAQQAKPDPQMQAVLDALKGLDAKPLHTLSVPEARTQASAADAARTVQREKKTSPYPEIKVATRDIAIPTAAGALPARV